MCGKENLYQCETCVCLSRGWGVWFINQRQGGKERCVGLVTTVGLKWCILLFFIFSLPRRSYFWLIYFLSGADQSLKQPEGQHAPVLCRLMIPGDALCTWALSGSAGYVFGGVKKDRESCPSCVSPAPLGWSPIWSALMLQWVGHEEIKKLLIYAGSISSEDMWICVRGGHRGYIVLHISIAPLKKTQTELIVALHVRQGFVPSQGNVQPPKNACVPGSRQLSGMGLTWVWHTKIALWLSRWFAGSPLP